MRCGDPSFFAQQKWLKSAKGCGYAHQRYDSYFGGSGVLQVINTCVCDSENCNDSDINKCCAGNAAGLTNFPASFLTFVATIIWFTLLK